MDNEPISIGKLSAKLSKAVGHDFSKNKKVYLREKETEALASRFPDTYLAKIEEMGKILKEPDYVLYDKQSSFLYFIKEYIKDGLFSKVIISLRLEKKWHVVSLERLSPSISQEIANHGVFVKMA